MPYSILTRFVFIVVVLFSAAQMGAQKASIGFRFMPTFSSFDLKTSTGGTVSGEATFGFGFGGLLGFNFTKHVGIQGEVIYSSLSQKYKEVDVERKVNLRYVNIPLLLSLNSGKSQLFNFNIVAGPQIGISTGSSLKVSGAGVSAAPAIVSVKKGDLGFAYGAGFDFGINTLHNVRFDLGYRGVIGLFDISDNSGTLTTDSYYILDRTHVKSNAVYLGLSLLF